MTHGSKATRKFDQREYAEFNSDVEANGGYQYTTNANYSSTVATQRHSESIWSKASFAGRRIVDIGCGDGTFTKEFLQFSPASVLGIDAASEAIEAARRHAANKPALRFSVGSAYDIAGHGQFDVAVLRGVLHHLERPAVALKQAMTAAAEVIVLEPNGYNFGLKILEKLSSYHRSHNERSFSPLRLRRWVRANGGAIVGDEFCCVVPYFCPEPVAKFLKGVERLVERTPLVRSLGCSTYTFRILRQRAT